MPAASPAPAAPSGWAPVPAPQDEGVGSGPRPRAAAEGTSGHVTITEVEQVAVLLDDARYGREVQWVIIRNESDQTVNVQGWNLTSEEDMPFSPNGLEVVRGYYDLAPGDYGVIVTSPHVELDRGVAVEYRNVFTLINPDIDYNFALHDFQQINLRNDRATLVDTNNPECLGGCCCSSCGGGNGCGTMCEDECPSSQCGAKGQCARWEPGECTQCPVYPPCCP